MVTERVTDWIASSGTNAPYSVRKVMNQLFSKIEVLWFRSFGMDFEPSRTRTCDPLVKSQLLYRLSYRPIRAESTPGVLFSVTRNFDRHST